VPRSIAIERFVSQAPADLLIAPRWGLKNYQFTNLLHNRLKALTQ
jgi:radical SAM superfamily enzyme